MVSSSSSQIRLQRLRSTVHYITNSKWQPHHNYSESTRIHQMVYQDEKTPNRENYKLVRWNLLHIRRALLPINPPPKKNRYFQTKTICLIKRIRKLNAPQKVVSFLYIVPINTASDPPLQRQRKKFHSEETRHFLS